MGRSKRGRWGWCCWPTVWSWSSDLAVSQHSDPQREGHTSSWSGQRDHCHELHQHSPLDWTTVHILVTLFYFLFSIWQEDRRAIETQSCIMFSINIDDTSGLKSIIDSYLKLVIFVFRLRLWWDLFCHSCNSVTHYIYMFVKILNLPGLEFQRLSASVESNWTLSCSWL